MINQSPIAHVNNLANVITGNAGNNLLKGGGGDDTLIGGAGSDTYRFARGDGRDVLIEAVDPASQDRLEFLVSGSGAVSYDQLWFSRAADSVIVSVMGTNDSVELRDFYGSASVETITAADSSTSNPNDLRTLSASGLAQLVNAMATMSPPAGATQWSSLPNLHHAQLVALGVWS